MTVAPRRCDIFCRIVDNFGDAGVSWRLARILVAEHGLDVTLWLDRPDALARIAPGIAAGQPLQRANGVTVRRWDAMPPEMHPADVVVEAFGGGLPESYLAAMAARASPPAWFVLEYLSAEPWVDDAHGLASPHPRLPLARRFWFPGFTPRTGGLLRERGLFAARDAFRASAPAQAALWTSVGAPAPAADETRISLFCYANPALPALLTAWSASPAPVVCVVPEGVAGAAIEAWTDGRMPTAGGSPFTRGRLALHVIPFVGQEDYDRLLWASHINFVRGEDSFVRAQWSARPFVWQAYPQAEAAHLVKVYAFADRYTGRLAPAGATAWRCFAGAWNGDAAAGPITAAWDALAVALPDLRRHGPEWAAGLGQLPDLAGELVKATGINV